MADNAGRLFTVIDAALNRSTGDLTVQTARNVTNSQAGVTPVPALTALIDRYDRLSAPRADAVVGVVTADITRRQNEAGESGPGGRHRRRPSGGNQGTLTPATRWWPS